MVAEKITQCMKPHGEEGFETIENMNENHREISEFAFKCIDINVNDNILDIGCGGVDYSEVSVKASEDRNQDAVDAKRCRIIQADVSDMPIGDEEYDLASAFETIYFWPDIGETFKEVSRIIRPKGKFMIAQGTDGNHPDDEKWLSTVEGMRVYTAPELEKYLLDAGFSSVKSFKKENEYILVVIAEK